MAISLDTNACMFTSENIYYISRGLCQLGNFKKEFP